jgi:ABC-type uncharacterized transport system substrate-binding protein
MNSVSPFSRVLGLSALLTCAALPAQAHPHVWVMGASTLQFENDLLTRVGMRWQFDAFFSQVLTGDFDTNKDGKLDADETTAMKNQVFTSLRDYGYFTHLRIDGAEVTFDRVENFSTGTDNGELVFFFDLVMQKPTDLRNTKTLLSLYDPSIYVDIVLGGDKPLQLQGISPDLCKWSFATGEEIANADGALTPQLVKLSCDGPKPG